MPALSPDLAVRIRGGSLDALEQLYRALGADLYRVAYRITLSRQDAEDVVHDVFLGLRGALNGYVEHGELQAWLKRVTTRAALMRVRTDRRREAREAVFLRERPEGGAGSDQGTGADVERLLAGLAPDLRVVVVLHELEGLPHREIARTLGITPVTSRVRLWRALDRLRRFVGREER